MKSVLIRSYFWFYFHVFGLNTERYGVISDPYFPVFGQNTERNGVSLLIQSEYRKIRTRNNSAFGHFLRSDVVPYASAHGSVYYTRY